MTAVNIDRVAGDADDALDVGRSRRVLPARRRIEDDDVASMVVIEVGRELVDENVLTWHQRVLHGGLLDLVGLGDEELDDQEEDNDYQERFDKFEKATECSTAHKSASIGAVLSSCPVELPKRLGLLKSGRFLRLISALAALALLGGILYNAIMVDRLPPTCTIQVSSTTSSGLARTLTSINVNFSETVRKDTAQGAFTMTEQVAGSPKVAGTFHWQGNKLIFTPSVKLPLSTKFHVHVASGVQDIAGNSQDGTQDIDFTTVGAPIVASVVPTAGTQTVPVDQSIAITFDREMDTQKVVAGLTLEPAITYQASWTGAVLTLKPAVPLEYATTYTVKIGAPAVDQDGSKLTPFSTSFRTVGIGLRVTTLVPAPNTAGVSIHSQIAVMFDSAIDPSSVAGAISITPPVSGSTKAIALPDDRNPTNKATPTAGSSGANVLEFIPDSPLQPDTTYFVTLSSTVKRTDGQVASRRTWTFITGVPPTTALNQVAFVSARSGVDNLWLMNPDGSNQREVTAELAPVSGYDISGDGMTVAYSAGGIVKKMSLSSDSVTTLTATGNFEYAPTITPDGTGVVVGRRGPDGTDAGYWLVNGADTRQVAPSGAPGLGSVAPAKSAANADPGTKQWAPRAAFTSDGSTMLLVSGSDGGVALIDMTGAGNPPIEVNLQGNSRPVWVQADGAFYVVGSDDNGATWSCWRIALTGASTKVGAGASDLTASGSSLALIAQGADGWSHVIYLSAAGQTATALTNDPSFSESEPSFSPDGSAVVFGRAGSRSPDVSAGIWKVNSDGTGLTDLSPDGYAPRWIP